MRTAAGWTWLLLMPSLLLATGQLPAPDKMPPPVELPPPRVLPAQEPAPGPASCKTNDLALPACDLAELKENFLKLKAEREALQVERISIGQAPSPNAIAQDNVKLRLRLSEVLTRLAS